MDVLLEPGIQRENADTDNKADVRMMMNEKSRGIGLAIILQPEAREWVCLR